MVLGYAAPPAALGSSTSNVVPRPSAEDRLQALRSAIAAANRHGITSAQNTAADCGEDLDRFDSILLTAPAYFHFVGYFVGFGIADGDQTRIFTNR